MVLIIFPFLIYIHTDNMQPYYYDSFSNVCLWGWKGGNSTEKYFHSLFILKIYIEYI